MAVRPCPLSLRYEDSHNCQIGPSGRLQQSWIIGIPSGSLVLQVSSCDVFSPCLTHTQFPLACEHPAGASESSNTIWKTN